MEFIKEESEDLRIEETFSLKQEDTETQTNMEFIKEESQDLKIEETFSVKQEYTEEQTKMAFIKEESEDLRIEEVFSLKQEYTEEQTKLAFIKEESQDLRIEETFSVKQEETEEQTVCSRSRQKNGFTKNMTPPDVGFSSFEECSSEEDYSPHSDENTDAFSSGYKSTPAVSGSSKRAKSVPPQPIQCSSIEQGMFSDRSSRAQDLKCEEDDDDTTTNNYEMLPSSKKTPAKSSYKRSHCQSLKNPQNTFSTQKNYCYVCKKPQSKIARHFMNHQDSEKEIAAAYSLPKHSQERKRLLEKLRNRGNYEHNQEVMESKRGQLKVRRRSGRSEIELSAKTHVHCVYCKGLFVRKELWRHTQRCPSKMLSESEPTGKGNVLILADIAESTFSQAISPKLWKILGNMKDDEISSVVRNDFIMLQLSQCLYNKHGSDPTKYDYIRQKVREMAKLLLSLRKKHSIFSYEDAVKPDNFYKVVEAIKDVAGYNEKSHSYKTPSLVMKLGRSLNKIGDIILSRALAAEDAGMTKAAERFKRLCSSEWAEHEISHATESKSEFNKPSTIPFTHDVQLLHQHLEKNSAHAFESLKNHESSQTYAKLAKVTLAQVIISNRRRLGEVSKITLECFRKIVQTELHDDTAVCLSPFEQQMSKHFSRVEIMDKKGRTFAILLNPELVRAMQLLVDKRDVCEVNRDNPFLFGRPNCSPTSFFRGQDCLRLFTSQCGAQHPEYLQHAKLRKQVATMSQILHLKDNELDQLANFLGHDIQVQRDYYRLPDATKELAKISKLLFAMEKGTLANFQGKSLDEIEIEDELDEEEISDDDDEESESGPGVTGKRKIDQDEAENSRGTKSRNNVKRTWRPSEVNAVMKHFKVLISKGRLATKAQCEQCKIAEDPVLKDRTAQNIRDFVRNRGVILKKKLS